MNDDDLYAKFDAVVDRDSFFSFMRALIADRESAVSSEKASPSCPYGPDAGDWENTSIERYLEASLACAENTDMSGSPSWKVFAQFLLDGKTYE